MLFFSFAIEAIILQFSPNRQLSKPVKKNVYLTDKKRFKSPLKTLSIINEVAKVHSFNRLSSTSLQQ